MPKAKPPAPPDSLVDRLLIEFRPRLAAGFWSNKKVTDVPAGKALLAADRDTQAAAVAEVMDRLADWERDYRAYQRTLGPGETNGSRPEWWPLYNRQCLLIDTLRALLRRKLPLSEALLVRLLTWPLREREYITCYGFAVHYLTLAVEYRAAGHEIGPKLRVTVGRLARRLRAATYDRDAPPIARRLEALAGPAR